MDKTDLFNTGFGNTFNRSDPQFEIRIDGVLNEHRNINPAQSIRHILHTKRVYCGSGTDPEYIHVKMQGVFHLFGGSDFHSNRNAGCLPGFLHPGQALGSDSFETTRAGSGFPDACPHNIHLAGAL